MYNVHMGQNHTITTLNNRARARGRIISSTRDECQADGQGRWQRRPVVGLARQPGSGVPSRPRQWKGGTADTRRASFPLCGVQKKGDRRRRAAAAYEGTDSGGERCLVLAVSSTPYESDVERVDAIRRKMGLKPGSSLAP